MRRATIDLRRFGVLLALITAAALAAGLSALVGSKPAEAAFPGNNGLIAFSSTRSTASGDPSSSDSEIFTAPLIGDLTQLTKNSTSDGEPTFSADGKKIAFTTNRDGNDEVYVMNADGTEQTNLTKNAADDYGPAFSPDGKKIAFTSFRNGNTDVYVIDSDGTDLKRLTKNSDFDGEPAWSPDGTRIAFTTQQRNGDNDNEIYVMKPRPEGKTNRPKNLTKSPGDDERPNWSPDGKQIVFATNRGFGGTYAIYKMNADGTGATHLTVNQSSFDYSPAWSPDGNFIMFQSTVSGNTDLWRMNANGSNQFNLTGHPATDDEPDWQPIP